MHLQNAKHTNAKHIAHTTHNKARAIKKILQFIKNWLCCHAAAAATTATTLQLGLARCSLTRAKRETWQEVGGSVERGVVAALVERAFWQMATWKTNRKIGEIKARKKLKKRLNKTGNGEDKRRTCNMQQRCENCILINSHLVSLSPSISVSLMCECVWCVWSKCVCVWGVCVVWYAFNKWFQWPSGSINWPIAARSVPHLLCLR